MWKTAIVMTLVISRLADAASAVEELALDTCTGVVVSSRGTHVGLWDDLPIGLHDGIATVASDGQTWPPRGDTRPATAPQHPAAVLSSASAYCA